ncbi:MAG TPA: hypothetical protein VJR29_04050 [bacterium]|nr:hypothetical protein [bacterium]
MKIFSLFAAALALAASSLASTAEAQNLSVNYTATANLDVNSVQPSGDRPESTAILTYLGSFKDFSDSNVSSSFFFDALGFIGSDGDTSSLSSESSRILTSNSVPLESLDSTDIFPLLFRAIGAGRVHSTSISVLSHDNVTFVRGTEGLSRDEDANPILSYIGASLKADTSSEAGDIKLKDPRYTLD